MSFAEQFLVVTLSVFLAVFLLTGIIVLIKVNQILGQVKNITSKAEHVVDQAEHVGAFFRKAAGPVAASKVVAAIIKSFKQKESKEK